MHLEYQVFEADFVNAGAASSAIKKTLKQLNVNPQIVKRVVVALYEAEVNAIAHAYGPGIPDIEWAMKEGNSTASPEVRNMGFGAGMGLPNIQKNVDRLDVQSTVGVGTTVEMEVRFN